MILLFFVFILTQNTISKEVPYEHLKLNRRKGFFKDFKRSLTFDQNQKIFKNDTFLDNNSQNRLIDLNLTNDGYDPSFINNFKEADLEVIVENPNDSFNFNSMINESKIAYSTHIPLITSTTSTATFNSTSPLSSNFDSKYYENFPNMKMFDRSFNSSNESIENTVTITPDEIYNIYYNSYYNAMPSNQILNDKESQKGWLSEHNNEFYESYKIPNFTTQASQTLFEIHGIPIVNGYLNVTNNGSFNLNRSNEAKYNLLLKYFQTVKPEYETNFGEKNIENQQGHISFPDSYHHLLNENGTNLEDGLFFNTTGLFEGVLNELQVKNLSSLNYNEISNFYPASTENGYFDSFKLNNEYFSNNNISEIENDFLFENLTEIVQTSDLLKNNFLDQTNQIINSEIMGMSILNDICSNISVNCSDDFIKSNCRNRCKGNKSNNNHCWIKTFGGNSNGKCCSNVFYYKGLQFYGCIRTNEFNNSLWCSITENYDADKLWTYCIEDDKTEIYKTVTKNSTDELICNEWTKWTDCVKNNQSRQRTCIDSKESVVNNYEYKKCENFRPKDNCSGWTNWTSCSKSCGNETMHRWKKCYIYKSPKAFIRHQWKKCVLPDCPDNNLIINNGDCGSWSQWSHCTRQCNNGIQIRQRICLFLNSYNKSSILKESRRCNEFPCALNCTEWTDWSVCSKTCDGGYQLRSKNCTIFGNSTEIILDHRSCNLVKCLAFPFENVPLRTTTYHVNNLIGNSFIQDECNFQHFSFDQVSMTNTGFNVTYSDSNDNNEIYFPDSSVNLYDIEICGKVLDTHLLQSNNSFISIKNDPFEKVEIGHPFSMSFWIGSVINDLLNNTKTIFHLSSLKRETKLSILNNFSIEFTIWEADQSLTQRFITQDYLQFNSILNWHHITVSKSQNSIKIFVDSVEVKIIKSFQEERHSFNEIYLLGNDYELNSPFKGFIDELYFISCSSDVRRSNELSKRCHI